MIKFVKNKDIDRVKWNDCIKKAVNGYLYAFSWYLDVVSEDWDALIEDDYSSVMPLPFKKRFGIELCYQPFFTQQLGVFSTNLLGGKKVNEFINAIPDSFEHIRINLNKFNQVESKLQSTFIHRNIELDLIPTYDKLSKAYNKNLKRKLAKAKKGKLNIVANVRPEIIIDLFLKDKGFKLKHLKNEDYSRLKRLIYAGMHNNTAKTFGVFDMMNQLVCGAVFFSSHQRLIFHFSANSEEGRESAAMSYLIDHVIQKNASRNLTLDFEGSDNEGLARFYLGFGSTESEYTEIILNRMKGVRRVLYSVYQNIKRR